MIKVLFAMVIKGIFVLGAFSKIDLDLHIPHQTSYDAELENILDGTSLVDDECPLNGLMNRCPNVSGISTIIDGIQFDRYNQGTLDNLKKICDLGIKRIDALVEGMVNNFQTVGRAEPFSRELRIAARNSFSIGVLTSSFVYLCQIMIFIESEAFHKHAREILPKGYELKNIDYIYYMQKPVTFDNVNMQMLLFDWFNNLETVWNEYSDIRPALQEYGSFWISHSGLSLDKQSKTHEFMHEIMKPQHDLLQVRDKLIKEFFENLLHGKN